MPTALLYTILVMSIRSKARNLFPISLMTISTISVLFIIEVRSEMLPMIPSRKLFFMVLSILAMIFLSALIAATNLSFLTNVTPSSVLLVALKRLNYVLFIFPLSLLMPGIVISSLLSQNTIYKENMKILNNALSSSLSCISLSTYF